MHGLHPSAALVGVALLNNLASGFSLKAPVPPPAAAFVRKSPTHRSANGGDILQRPSAEPSVFRTTGDCDSPLGSRGGATKLGLSKTKLYATADDGTLVEAEELKLTKFNVVASLWGASGVVYILGKAIKRVMPIALEPLRGGEGVVPMTQFQLA